MWHGEWVPNLLGSLFGLFVALLLSRFIAAVGGRLN
jgi:hypothetical protein